MATTSKLTAAVLTSFVGHIQHALTTLYTAGVSLGGDGDFGTVVTVLENAKDMAQRRIAALTAPVPAPAPAPVPSPAKTPTAPTAKVDQAKTSNTQGQPTGKQLVEVTKHDGTTVTHAVCRNCDSKCNPAFVDEQGYCSKKPCQKASGTAADAPKADSKPSKPASKPAQQDKPAAETARKADSKPAQQDKPAAVPATLPTSYKALAKLGGDVVKAIAAKVGVKADGLGFGELCGQVWAMIKPAKTEAPATYAKNTILIADGKGGLHEVSLSEVLGMASESELWAALEKLSARKAA